MVPRAIRSTHPTAASMRCSTTSRLSGSGDLMEMTWLYSDDGGARGLLPVPLPPVLFMPIIGNDAGQPNIGDYNMGVAQNGTFFAVYPTTPNLVSLPDIQTPQNAFPYPSFLPSTIRSGFAGRQQRRPPCSLVGVTFTDSGGNGFADAGDQLRLKFPLVNSLTNAALSPVTYTRSRPLCQPSRPELRFRRVRAPIRTSLQARPLSIPQTLSSCFRPALLPGRASTLR